MEEAAGRGWKHADRKNITKSGAACVFGVVQALSDDWGTSGRCQGLHALFRVIFPKSLSVSIVSGGVLFGGGGWWWVVVGGGGWWWVVVGGGGWWWVVVGGGGGWWWVVMGGDGWHGIRVECDRFSGMGVTAVCWNRTFGFFVQYVRQRESTCISPKPSNNLPQGCSSGCSFS